MASWLTHLRIAEKIKQRIDEIDFPYLAMGSIAPDSGMPDESRMSYTPSKETTHYTYKGGDGISDIDDAAFFNKYLIPEKIMTRSDSTRSFLWGYYFHLISDKMWIKQFFEPFKKDFLQNTSGTEVDFIKYIREEMHSLDFIYLKEHGSELLKELERPCSNIHFFYEFDWDYIYGCRKRIVEFYKADPLVIDRELKYLTPDSNIF
jgi:hypothetical protein